VVDVVADAHARTMKPEFYRLPLIELVEEG